MRLLAATLALFITGADAQRSYRLALPRGCQNRGCERARVTAPPDPYAAFEFAPASGAGMTAECSGATPTGARGEPMSFARTGGATCTTGNTVAIAPGAVHKLTDSQPRVMRGGTGTGPLLLWVEGAATNTTTHRESFDNAAWSPTTLGGASAPVVTANVSATPAPDGTLTADRIQSPATSASQYSVLIHLTGCATASNVSAGVYIQGYNGASGTTDFCIATHAGTFTCMPAGCSFASGTITRCAVENVATNDLGYLIIGNASNIVSGTPARGASDFVAWGAQCEVSPYLSSYIFGADDTSAATRNADTASFAVTPASDLAGSWGARVLPPSALVDGRGGFNHYTDGTKSPMKGVLSSSKWRSLSRYLNVNDITTTAGTLTAISPNLVGGYYDGASVGACVGGANCSNTQAPVVLPTAPTTLYVGKDADTAGSEFGGGVGQICYDPNALRCIPGGYQRASEHVDHGQPQFYAMIGDSILAGTLVSVKPPQRIPQAAQNSWFLDYANSQGLNYAIPGQTSSDCNYDWETYVKPSGGNYGVLFLSCGINSAWQGTDAGGYQQDLDTIVLEAADAGWRVIQSTITPCYSGTQLYCDGGTVTRINLMNAHIAAVCGATPNCHLSDDFAQFNDGGNGLRPDCINNNGDGLHLNDTCTKEKSALMAGKLR